MNRRVLILIGLLSTFAGCGGNDFSASPDPISADGATPDAAPDGAAGGDSSQPDAVKDTGKPEASHEASTEAAADAVGEETGPTCSILSGKYEAEADTTIIQGQCNGSISYGDSKYLNIGLGRGLFSFKLDAAAIAALLTPSKIKKMTLTLEGNADCEGAGSCPDKVPGPVQAFPLRNDWTEGDGAAYSGADWCRRGAGSSGPTWNSPGADGDHGPAAGTSNIDKSLPNLSFDLQPSSWDATWIDGSTGRISVLVVAVNCLFIAASHESTLHGHPMLVMEWCK
ncbi:MAG: hypothetical protein HY898_36435 [Deltaproteobacteria bacterium]|nr:hypothetical protein [Deltaproteobacteria bacterium]